MKSLLSSLLLLIPILSYSVIADFRRGQFPTAAYNGAIDAQIVGGTSAANNYGALTSISIDNNNTTYSGGPPSRALLRFDITTIPAFSIVNSATLTLNVTNPSSGTYQLYQVLRAWTEGAVSFNTFNGITNWATAGCSGIGSDRNNTILVNTIANSTGSHSLILNAAGVAVIQSWVNTPGNNFGFIFQGTSTDGYDFDTKEHSTITNRPRLTIDYTSTLPIELFYFNAVKDNYLVKLTWNTASEKDNDYFEIERSDNGELWNTIGIIDGAGNSEKALHYEYNDLSPLYGISYYRLKQIDHSKQFSYSPIIVVDFQSDQPFTFYPNPFENLIVLEGLDTDWNIRLYDTHGKEINLSYLFQNTKAIIETSLLPPGVYFLEVETASKRYIKKLMK